MKNGFSVWLEADGRYVMGEREAKILEGIKKYGSFMATSKSLGNTYAHTWNVADELASRIGSPVVKAQRGGDSGGGAALTETGESLLDEYLALEEKVSRLLGSRRELSFMEFRRPDLSIIGSSCVGVKILASMLSIFSTEVVEVGSTVGLAALMLGEADITGIHLYDEESGSYNIPFIRRSWSSGSVSLIRGYRREQGLMLKRGNPKGIKGVQDLAHSRIRLVNRNQGSGTRELLDRLLRQKQISPKDLRGYDFEVRTHEEVARAIEEGRADVGLGLRATASIYGLSFVKVCDEDYDFAVETKRITKPPIRAFVELLGSEAFRIELEKRAPGIKLRKETGKIVSVE